MPSREERNKAVVRRWIDDVLNGGDLEALEDLAAADYVYHGPGVGMHGVGELKPFIGALRASFPDFHPTVDLLVAEGDLTAMRFTITGTQQADFMGIPARGGRLDLPFQVISRLQDGKVAEDWEVYDTAEMLRQLGAEAETTS